MRFSLKLAAIVATILAASFAGNLANAQTPEDLWKSLEKLPAAEREKKLIEGAKKEGDMVWYTNSGIENATRYIQGFKKKYPFINANFWRSKTRQVTQRIVAEANAGKHLVDVIKPSTDLLPVLLERNLIGKYDTPLRAIYPAHAKSPFYTNMNYAFRVFAFNPRKVNAKDVPKTWEELLQSEVERRDPLRRIVPRRSHGAARRMGQRENRELSEQAQPAAALDPRRPRYHDANDDGRRRRRGGHDLRLQQRRACARQCAGRLGRARI